MNVYNAILIGATGLVGSKILHQLLEDKNYNSVLVFHRRSTGVSHPKLQEHIIDFDNIDSWKSSLQGTHLFSALGTTIKQAGSKDTQYKIDYTYQYNVAKAAAENGVKSYSLVSSLGADTNSNSFYPRIKGELDEAIQQLPFKDILIIRPSLLDGDRKEFRLGERLGIFAANIICKIPGLKKYHPIKAEVVAQAMIKGIKSTNGTTIIEGSEIHSLL